MPLPTPKLDDRHFQDIVDQAKRLIPQYCREWTDHNVSDTDLTIRPPNLIGVFTRNVSRGRETPWVRHNLEKAGLPGQSIEIFPHEPGRGDAFILALEKDHSHHVLALVVNCERAGGAGVDPK